MKQKSDKHIKISSGKKGADTDYTYLSWSKIALRKNNLKNLDIRFKQRKSGYLATK